MTTLILDDALIDKARGITGVSEKTALVHEGLRALIARESARKLAALGGSERKARALLSELPSLPLVSHEDVLAVSRLGLDGSDVGWIDARLVASAIAGRARLWTLDRPLSRAARAADIAIDL